MQPMGMRLSATHYFPLSLNSPQLWFRVPAKIYHKAGCLEEALSDLRGKERAIVITGELL